MSVARTCRRLLSILLACALSLIMLPATAFAGQNGPGALSPLALAGEGTPEKPYVISSADDFEEALTVADGNTVVYVKLGSDLNADLVVAGGKKVSLNLNGKTLTNVADHTITVKPGAVLTVTGAGTVDNVTNAKAAIFNDAGGTATLSGGNYTRSKEAGKSAGDSGGNSFYTIQNYGNMTLNSGVSVSQGPEGTGQFSSLIENGYYDGNGKSGEAIMDINGGTFTGGLNTVKNDDWGVLTVHGGTFENFAQSCFLNWNEAVIAGGNFDGSNASEAVILNGFADENMDKGMLDISGGNFTGNTAIGKMNDADRDVEDVTIIGGVFSDDVSSYCANGYKVEEIAGKNVVVTDNADDAVAVVGEHGFNSVSNAVAAAQSGETIFLKENSSDFSFTIPNDIQLTFDLGGHELSMTGYTYVDDVAYANGTKASLVNEGSLVIENGTIKGNAAGANTIANKGDGSSLTLASGAVISTAAGWDTVVNLGGTVTTYADIANSVGDCFTTYGGVLNVEGGNITASGYGMSSIVVFNRAYNNGSSGAKVAVKSGTLTSYGYAISTNNLNSGGSDPSDVAITGGSIAAEWSAIYWPSSGTLTIGSIDGAGPSIAGDSAVEVCSGTLEIYGGDFVGQGNNGPTDDYLVKGYRAYSGAAGPGDAVTIIAHRGSGYDSAPLDVEIAGGTFSSKNDYAVRYLDCNEAEGADQIVQDVNVCITGGSFAGAAQDIEAVYVSDDANRIISGGYFTSDPSAYVAEGKAVLPGDIAGYAFMVDEEIETDVEPAVGTPSVTLGDDITEDDEDVVLASASSVTASGELAAAANEAIGEVTEQQMGDAKAAFAADDSVDASGQDVKIYAQAYLDIKPTAYDSSNKTMTLDITPMYRVVASTATSAGGIELIGDDKNAVVLADSEKELAGINTMTLSITLPYGFVQDVDAPVYVQHKDYEYTATVTQQSGSGNNSYTATFTNPHGFSEFTIGTASKAVATFGNTSYTTLQAALAAAQDGDTITVLRDGLSASMSGDSRSVNLQSGTSQEMRVTINNQLITIPASGMGSYTYTASSAGIGGGGGSAPAAEEYEVTVAPSEHGKVAAEPAKAAEGDTVTLTVTPDEGYELTYLSVLDADKAEVELAQNADGTYSFEMPASEVAVYAVFSCDGGELCPSHGFADVDQSQWYHEAIDWAVANKVLNGFDDTGLMAPDGEVTRAQMAQILWNVEGRPVVDYAIGFGDVTEGDWFYQAVAWAASEGIFKGYDDGSGLFGPGDVLTREQAAAVLMRWTEANGGDVDARADLSAYPDVDGISAWAVESGCVSWAVATGVISGVEQEDGSLLLDPVGTATRAQTAMLMMRLTAE